MVDGSSFESTIRQSAWAKKQRLPWAGLVAALVRGRAVHWVRVGRKVDAHTPLEAGSLTKLFTGLLLANSIQREELTLDTPLDEALGTTWVGPPAVTMRQLVTHTSGLPRLSTSPRLASLATFGDPYRGYGRVHLHRYLDSTRPRSPTTSSFRYSNLGYAVLGLALESRCRKTYESLLQERLLSPLGLAETTLQLVGRETRSHAGYNRFGWWTRPWHFDAYAPCGALVTTASDLVRAVQALTSFASPLAEEVDMALAPLEKVPNGTIGMAWLKGTGMDYSWHNGATFGYSAFLAIHRKLRAGVVLMTNQFRGAMELARLGNQLMRMPESL